jgi:hypothetical protein
VCGACSVNLYPPQRLQPLDLDKVRAAQAMVAKRILTAREDFTEFVSLAAVNQEGLPVELTEMHLAWHRHVDYCWSTGRRCMILAHFGSGKSSSFAVPLLAWMIGRNPQVRCKVVTNSDDNSKQRVAGVRRIIESSTYRYIFPAVRPGGRWTEKDFTVERKGAALDATMQARPVFGKGIGQRADILLFDDVCDQSNSGTLQSRRKVRDTVEQTWLSRLEPGNRGYVLWVATPWHVDDTTHHLMNTPGWCTLRQWVSEDCERIEQEVLGADLDYPGIAIDTAVGNRAVG